MMQSKVLSLLFIFLLAGSHLNAQTVCNEKTSGNKKIFNLENKKISVNIEFVDNILKGAKIFPITDWQKQFSDKSFQFVSDEGFKLHTIWTSWRAPYKQNNGDIEYILTQSDFLLTKFIKKQTDNGVQLDLLLTDKDEGILNVLLSYYLENDKNYFKRKISISDTIFEAHFLDRIFPYDAKISAPSYIENPGGFGQPVALKIGSGGMYAGIEYPAATNILTKENDNTVKLSCWQEIGEKISKKPISSEWVVVGIVPENAIKKWFFQYVDDIRVAPAKPYALYNSWYDLRSSEYPKVAPKYWMTEENILRIIGLIRKNMIEKHDIKLDAVVLDDGWDVYKSDWKIREKELPNGLKPIADELKKTNTGLGIWFGPTGGYSFRKQRIQWMKDHGYEVVGKEYDYNAMSMCVGGKNYSKLLIDRTVDMVKNQGVTYFKWDGIQFSCSEADHGHPTGLYSRRAIMEVMVAWCKAVREANPDVYLNITSGTWLSPWWLKYANQIWMDGGDHGWADVSSISMRDAAITYRDGVLYDDFKIKNLWFPIANLMTHGIIKGDLELLGGEDDPIEKFTHDVLFYFARGVTMYELYISPDILNEEEWNAISQSMKWARFNADILSKTEMVGGNPNNREPYGYVHFKEKNGIIAIRNPYIDKTSIKIKLSPDYGLDKDATKLVVERIYPDRYILPELYDAGKEMVIPLEGYETAVYEVYPLESATYPLIAGIEYTATTVGNTVNIEWYNVGKNAKVLNPEKIVELFQNGQKTVVSSFKLTESANKVFLEKKMFNSVPGGNQKETTIDIVADIALNSVDGYLAVLIKPDSLKPKIVYPVLTANSKNTELKVKMRKDDDCAWYFIPLNAGQNLTKLSIKSGDKNFFQGSIYVWATAKQKYTGGILTVKMKNKPEERPLPPAPLPAGLKTVHGVIGQCIIKIKGID